MTKATLNLSPLLEALRREAQRLGVSFPALLTADLARYRALAEAAVPRLPDEDWRQLEGLLAGIEAEGIVAGDDRLPKLRRIAAGDDREAALLRRLAELPPLALAGVLLRLRRER